MDTQLEEAKSIVRAFVQGSWNTYWEDMIGKENRRGGCVIDVLGLKCKTKQRRSVSEDAAERIRHRHPNLWDSETTWNAKKRTWKVEEIAKIVSIIEKKAQEIGVLRKASNQPKNAE